MSACADALTAGVPVDPALRSPEQQARWLLAQLLSWHRREEKSTWWRYYHLLDELTDEERIEEKEPIGGLEPLGMVGEVARSALYRYRYPPQEHDFEVGDEAHDPATRRSAGTVYAIDDAERTIDLKRGRTSNTPDPTSIVPLKRVDSTVLQDSLLRIGEWVAQHGVDAPGPYGAARDLLLRAPPRLRGPQPAGRERPMQTPGESALDAAVRLGSLLHESVLPIQGPPGAGKTFIGARMIVRLIASGRRVGITANSHKVIGNLLAATLAAARAEGVAVHAIQKATVDEALNDPDVQRTEDNGEVVMALGAGSACLAAGTAWLWARPQMAGAVDILFVDEAGQMSLANVVAAAPAAASLVLLGDPLQLDQPIKGVHPPGVAVSALGHLLGEESTMPADRGLFLEETWRLHPDLCRFTSVAFYDRRLGARPGLEAQQIRAARGSLEGSGPRLVHAEHAGNDNASIEEVTLIAEMVRELVERGATWIDHAGVERALGWGDVLIVAAYNAQVAAIKGLLPAEARVGTVDRFQGQEAPISFYSMASSSAADAPRGMTFLYNRNRLNVATSRARCVAVVVCAPELLAAPVRTVQEMRLANTLCLFAEHASLLPDSGDGSLRMPPWAEPVSTVR